MPILWSKTTPKDELAMSEVKKFPNVVERWSWGILEMLHGGGREPAYGRQALVPEYSHINARIAVTLNSGKKECIK